MERGQSAQQLINVFNNIDNKENIFIKSSCMLKLANNRARAHTNGNNWYQFYWSVRYNGTCLLVNHTPQNPRDYINERQVEKTVIESATS